MKKEMIVKGVTLGDNGEIISMRGIVVSKDKIVDLDNMCYHTMLSDLDIEEMI